MGDSVEWQRKTREFRCSLFDSTYWNDFEFRDDDIIVSTYAKAGTTWVQQIIAQFVFNGETDDVLTLGMGHGLANDDEIQVYQAGSPALPVGLSVDQIYFVISQSGNTISLSLTQGGGAVDLTVAGEGILVGKPLRSAA